jgi:DNA-binding NarL/FixJ family response regulator
VTAAIRLVLVDDHIAFRKSLALILKREPDLAVLAQAGSVVDARDMLGGVPGGVDVALIDLQLPDGDGVKVIGDVRVMHPGAWILALTAVIDPSHHARAIDAGAVKIISKAAQPAEIIACIRQTRAGPLVASGR